MASTKRARLERERALKELAQQFNDDLHDPGFRRDMAMIAGRLRRRSDALSRMERMALAVLEAAGIEPSDEEPVQERWPARP
jgi:hypothetical protein